MTRVMNAVPHSLGRKIRRFTGDFQVVGTGHPLILYPITLLAAGWSRAERMSAGKYEFELAEDWPRVFNPTLGSDTFALYTVGVTYGTTVDNEDIYVQYRKFPHATTGKLVVEVKLKTGATNTDPNGAGGGRLSLFVDLEASPQR